MDKILELAKDLAREIQMDERFVRVQMAQTAADGDAELQEMIGDFNLKRMAISTETAKDEGERDTEKMKALDTELREVYARVMANDNMKRYNDAKTGLDDLLGRVNRILTLAAQGLDPEAADAESSCTGNCSSCGGCH